MASLQVYSLSIDGWQWREHTPDVEGAIPEARYGHAAAALEGHALLLCAGGDAEAGRFRSDVAVLDTRTWRWSAPATVVRRRVHILACKSTQCMCDAPPWPATSSARCARPAPPLRCNSCACASRVLLCVAASCSSCHSFICNGFAEVWGPSRLDIQLACYSAAQGQAGLSRKSIRKSRVRCVIVMRVQAGSTPGARTGHMLAALAAPGEAPRFLVAAGRGPGDVLHSDAWVLQMRPQEAVVPASV